MRKFSLFVTLERWSVVVRAAWDLVASAEVPTCTVAIAVDSAAHRKAASRATSIVGANNSSFSCDSPWCDHCAAHHHHRQLKQLPIL